MIKKEVKQNFISNNKVSYNYIRRAETLGMVATLYSVGMFALSYFFPSFTSFLGKWDLYINIAVLVIGFLLIISAHIVLNKLAMKYQLKLYNEKKKGKKK